MSHDTPEGRIFRSALAGPSEANVVIGAQRACSCGCGQKAGVLLDVNGHAAVASSAAKVLSIVRTLLTAAAMVWGDEALVA